MPSATFATEPNSSSIAIAATLAPPCSGPFSAQIAATIAECMSAFVPATTRAANVEAFSSCSAWRIIAISNARASSAVGASPRSIVRKFSAYPSDGSGSTAGSPRRRRS